MNNHDVVNTDKIINTNNQPKQLNERIVMYYDSSCPICRTEAYHMRDEHSDKIKIVTIDEGMEELAKFDISKVDAMTYLCVQARDGSMYKGIDAVRLLNETAGTKMAVILSLPITKQIANWIYPIFARNRYYMPDWFTKLMFGKVADEECADGICKTPPSKR